VTAAPPSEWVCSGYGRALPDVPEGCRPGDGYGFGAYADGHPDGVSGDGVCRYWCLACSAAQERREEAFVVGALTSIFGEARAKGGGRADAPGEEEQP